MNTITFLGDVFLPQVYQARMDFGGRYVFNLESPITTASTGWPGKVNLRAEANHILATFGDPPAAVCLANNHIMDYGARGLEDTLEELRRTRIPVFGAGPNESHVGNPLFLEDGVALLGYACPSTSAIFATSDEPGAARLELDRVVREIAAARRAGARRVIVSLHWGEEHVFLPKPADVATGRRIIDAGADLVIGHHAHRAQAFEVYRGRHVFYGLGNCITPDIDQPSFFDTTGRSTGRALRKQHWWNRKSLAVDYDVDSGAVKVRELIFDGNSLQLLRPNPAGYVLPFDDDAAYAARYRRAFTRGKLQNKVMNYVKTPRLPRPRHLKSILAIAREVSAPRESAR